jgi:Effector protein
LVIKGVPTFIERVTSDLHLIRANIIGKELLQSLYSSGKIITIVHTSRYGAAIPNDYHSAIAKGKTLEWKELYGQRKSLLGTGKGSDTVIQHNADRNYLVNPACWQNAPSAIWLAHELIHADDAAWGRMDPDLIDGVYNFERQAIGLSPYEQKEFTENKLRCAWMPPQPLRTTY